MERATLGFSTGHQGDPLLLVISATGSLMTTVSRDLSLSSHLKDGFSCVSVTVGDWELYSDPKEDCPLLAQRHHCQHKLSFPRSSPMQVPPKPTHDKLQSGGR